jgi:hypothetical protein
VCSIIGKADYIVPWMWIVVEVQWHALVACCCLGGIVYTWLIAPSFMPIFFWFHIDKSFQQYIFR